MNEIREFKIIEKCTKDYPIQLYDLKDCPKQLYIAGNLKILSEFSISIVGTRNCSKKSEERAQKISYDLAMQGVNIISGLAIGVDRFAHEGALNAKGKTIAILGGGFNNLYPKENIKLLYNILENNGLIITEYEPDVPCFRQNFLKRNRIIAALSYGIIIVEAKKKSGSLATANCGLKINRNIFSFPNDIDDYRFEGCNKLLVNGAKCILNYEDVLKEYDDLKLLRKKRKKDVFKYNKIPREYLEIYSVLKNKRMDIDELKRCLNIPISELNSKLILMELERLIKTITRKEI